MERPEAFLFGKVDREDFANEDRRPDDADDGKGVGAGVCHRNIGSRVVKRRQRFLRGAEPRGVRDGPVVDAEHLREVDRPRKRKGKRHGERNREKNSEKRQAVQFEAARAKAREKGRPDLKADKKALYAV